MKFTNLGLSALVQEDVAAVECAMIKRKRFVDVGEATDQLLICGQ